MKTLRFFLFAVFFLLADLFAVYAQVLPEDPQMLSAEDMAELRVSEIARLMECRHIQMR